MPAIVATAILIVFASLVSIASARNAPDVKPEAVQAYDRNTHLRRCPPRELISPHTLPCHRREGSGLRYTRLCMAGEHEGVGSCPSGLEQGSNWADPQANDWACTRDEGTGLVWSLHSSEPLSWAEAAATGAGSPSAGHNAENGGVGRCGFSDWRLPSLRELKSVIGRRHAEAIPARRADYFPNIVPFFYWTGESYAPDSSRVWTVDFSIGSSRPVDRTLQAHVVLVRGGD